jgi:hypothetical protein
MINKGLRHSHTHTDKQTQTLTKGLGGGAQGKKDSGDLHVIRGCVSLCVCVCVCVCVYKCVCVDREVNLHRDLEALPKDPTTKCLFVFFLLVLLSTWISFWTRHPPPSTRTCTIPVCRP